MMFSRELTLDSKLTMWSVMGMVELAKLITINS